MDFSNSQDHVHSDWCITCETKKVLINFEMHGVRLISKISFCLARKQLIKITITIFFIQYLKHYFEWVLCL